MTDDEIERYSRHLLLRGWGEREQEALSASEVVVPAVLELSALLLAAAGAGTIVLSPGSCPTGAHLTVSLLSGLPQSNIADMAAATSDELAHRLRELNPRVKIQLAAPSPESLLSESGRGLLRCDVELSVADSESRISLMAASSARSDFSIKGRLHLKKAAVFSSLLCLLEIRKNSQPALFLLSIRP